MTTQAATWGGFHFIDRQSDLVNEDGSRDCLDPDLAQALIQTLGPTTNRPLYANDRTAHDEDPHLKAALREILTDIGIADMDDLGGVSLEELLQGILEG